ncbi:MAG: bifunctional methylenetetrahydrofolate dehydrogenase/methenyltetrahydrofolate cyclohydrolase FolD [Bacteroidetes bacterium]|nr:bifunctional methylenetetrahydrofolate dehydrogenase/methenyltetrahydrofolate cyclohydrolase FolD [Bacteroidota bacterium]
MIMIDGKQTSQTIRNEIKVAVEKLKKEGKQIPGLAFILVGNNPASVSYVTGKGKACEEVGFYSVTERLPAETSETDVLALVQKFNNDSAIHGILVQLPLPKHIDEQKVIEAINPKKDVDGFHPINVGKMMIGLETFYSCTPFGIVELLKRYNINPSGKHVVVVGRSNIVGKPVANMLLQKKEWANAVVTVAHTGAKDISYYTKQADILIAAVGKPNAITADMIKEGAVIIDVGINRIDDVTKKTGFRLVGDVDFENVKEKSSAITPVPGGVGPMTIAMLLVNTLKAAENSNQ